MLERLAPAALAAMLLGLAVTGAVPAEAQTTTEAATQKPAAAAEQPASPASDAACDARQRDGPAPAPAPTPAVAEPPPPPPVDPLLAEVRRQLAEPAARQRRARRPRRARGLLWRSAARPLLWVAKDGLTARARHAMAEIAKADDWGLAASAFELPQLPQGEASAAALAAAEIKLGLAVLKYARHARGGRIDPAALSKHLDHEADPARAQGRARCRGRYRHAGRLPARAASQAPAVPAPAPGPAQGAWRRQRSATLRARQRRPHGRAPARRPAAQARLGASPRRPAAPASGRAAVARRREHLRSRAAGRAQGLPGPQQHPDLGPADAAHALRAQCRRAERQAAGQARARGVRGAAADRQHGALALDARGAGRDAHLGQHPRVHHPRLQEGPGHPYRQDHRRQAEHADGGVLGHR